MNERVMQFRIGMFVIVAGLVLTMLIIWFGESPALFRDNAYITVMFPEAPGVAIGIPVRKSGIRIGEVAEIEFDQREGTDGVLVTLAMERQFRLRAGSVPRLGRALIGDVSIDILPGTGEGPLALSATPSLSKRPERIIQGEVSPDPSKALAAATQAFEQVGGTLNSIDKAARGLAKLTDSADGLQDFLKTWDHTGAQLGTLSDDLRRVVRDNESDFRGALAGINQVAAKVNTTLDEETQRNVRDAARKLADATSRIDQVMEQLSPLAADLGAKPGSIPGTSAGQAVLRINRIAYELSLLTGQLSDPSGKLNPNGTLQKLLMTSDLHDNLNRASLSLGDILAAVKPILRNLNEFAERIARDPSAIGRGALQR